MGSFDLLANPFAVLGVSTRDDRDAIARAVEARLADPSADETRVRRAHQVLMAPRPRLDAELTWLIGVEPKRAHALLAALDGRDAESMLAALPALARANVAAQLAHRHRSAALVGSLIQAYDEIDPDELIGEINADRAVAGLPGIAPELMAQALAAIREQHLEAAQAALTADPHPGRLMTRLVEAWLKAEGSGRDLLEALAKRYDRWSVPILDGIEARLDAAADRLRAEPKNGAALEEIVRGLVQWDEYSQPCQLLLGQKLVDEPRSNGVAQKLRALALWLGNERQEYRRALAITKALLTTFPELPGIDATLQEDLKTLETLVRRSEEMQLLTGLSRAVEAARNCPTLGNEVERGDFGPEGRGVAAQLYAAFARAARRAVGHEHADLPWQALRQLALELHNEHTETEAALCLTVAILSFAEVQPSAEMTQRLRDDEATLRRELLWSEAFALAKAGRLTEALEHLRDLEALAKDAAERKRIETIRSQLTQRRSQVTRRRIGWAVAAGVIGMIGLANLASEPVQPRAANRAVAPPPAGTRLLSDQEFIGSQQSADGIESPPPVGSDRVLTTDQIRYCLFQGERLEAFRPVATSNAQIREFNRLVDDLNSRCSRYRYRPDSMQAVQRELGAEKVRLRREGMALAEASVAAGADNGPGSATTPRSDRWWEGAPLAQPARPAKAGGRLLNPAASLADAQEAQSRLAALGYYAAAIDGVWGPGSRRALIEFKRRAGLPANADWDRPTQNRLFRATDG